MRHFRFPLLSYVPSGRLTDSFEQARLARKSDSEIDDGSCGLPIKTGEGRAGRDVANRRL